jgi:hypothetical protein
MTLLERCQNIRHQIEQRDTLRKDDKKAEVYRERASDLSEIRIELVFQVKRFSVLRNKGVAVGKPPSPMGGLEVLREVQSLIASNAEGSGKDFGRLKNAVNRVHKDLEGSSSKALDILKSDLPTIEESYLRQVELIPTYFDRVARIREDRNRLLNGQDIKSMNPQELELFLDRRAAFRSVADQLNPKEFPKEILEFFKAARQGGAPLEKFTEAVQEWLGQRDLLKNVRVQIQR